MTPILLLVTQCFSCNTLVVQTNIFYYKIPLFTTFLHNIIHKLSTDLYTAYNVNFSTPANKLNTFWLY